MAEKKVNDSEKFSSRWGIPLLDEVDRYIPVYEFMLRNYAKVGVSRSEFLLIIHLAAYKYERVDKGESRPSLETIAKQMGYASSRYVRDLVASLEAKGMLEIHRLLGKPSIYEFKGFAEAVLKAVGLDAS